jgi:hypothetical protein
MHLSISGVAHFLWTRFLGFLNVLGNRNGNKHYHQPKRAEDQGKKLISLHDFARL